MPGVIDTPSGSYVLNLVPSTPDQRDFKFAAAPALILQDTYDLVAGFTYDQGRQGSCTGNAQAKLFRMLLKAQGMTDFQISRAMIYYESRLLEGTQNQDSGSTIADSMRGMYLKGACSEQTMPYRDTDYTTAPTPAAETEAADHQVVAYGLVQAIADGIGAALDAKHPVSAGAVLYENFIPNTSTGVIPMPSGSVIGAHNFLLTGRYHSRRLYIADNSWSEQWGVIISGQPGRFLIPYDYIHNPQLTFETKTMSMVEGVIVPPPTPPTPPDPDEVTKLYQDILRILGPIDGIPIHFQNGYTWPLAIQAPPQ
jgi:hypothetical protein